YNDRILILDPATGSCVGGFGSHGRGNGQYSAPRTLRSDGTGGLWIGDASNYRVVHVRNDGTFLWATTDGFGTGPYQSRTPPCLFYGAGDLHVCDTWNYRVPFYRSSGDGLQYVDEIRVPPPA